MERRRSSPPPPLYKPTFWGSHLGEREGRPKQERDSLRSRSKEGRPGSRKHRRWTHSVELVGSLRRAMAKVGENSDHVAGDPDSVTVEAVNDWRPSVFYKLLEHEGPGGALEAWAAAENSRRQTSRPRVKDAARLAEEQRITVRRALGDLWHYVSESGNCQDFIKQLEKATTRAFGAKEESGHSSSEEDVALRWLLSWDGDSFKTKAGAPPTNEMAVLGLEPVYRKVVHQLAQIQGLTTSSHTLEEQFAPSGCKVLTIRPPRSRCGSGGAWRPPFSVSKVLTTA